MLSPPMVWRNKFHRRWKFHLNPNYGTRAIKLGYAAINTDNSAACRSRFLMAHYRVNSPMMTNNPIIRLVLTTSTATVGRSRKPARASTAVSTTCPFFMCMKLVPGSVVMQLIFSRGTTELWHGFKLILGCIKYGVIGVHGAPWVRGR